MLECKCVKKDSHIEDVKQIQNTVMLVIKSYHLWPKIMDLIRAVLPCTIHGRNVCKEKVMKGMAHNA